MTDDETDSLEARLAAVERALTDGDPVADLSDAAELQRQLDAQAEHVDTLTERLDALQATVQSLHGYVGQIEHVNERVERRADAARAAVERLDDQDPRSPQPGPAQSGPHEPRTRDSDGAEPGTDRTPATDSDADTASPLDDDVERWNDAEAEDAASLLDRLRSSL